MLCLRTSPLRKHCNIWTGLLNTTSTSVSDKCQPSQGYLVDLRYGLLPSFRALLITPRSKGRPQKSLARYVALHYLRSVEHLMPLYPGQHKRIFSETKCVECLTLAGTASCDPSASRGRRQPEAHTQEPTHLTPSITDKHLLPIPIVTQSVFSTISARSCPYP